MALRGTPMVPVDNFFVVGYGTTTSFSDCFDFRREAPAENPRSGNLRRISAPNPRTESVR